MQIYIEVTPGFVMKTCDVASQKKVFVNVCQSSDIQTFSQKKKLDDQGKEQEVNVACRNRRPNYHG